MKKTIILSTLFALFLDLIQYMHSPHSLGSAARLAPAGNNVAIAATAPTRTPTITPAPAVVAASTPAPDPSLTVAARLTAAGLNSRDAALYLAVQARTGTPWQLVAAVHSVESHQSSDTNRTSSAGAVGPFQFMPATWRAYALDGNGDGVASITSLNDSAMTAGRYLAGGGAASGDYRTALYHYNHSNAYVNKVLTLADKLGL